jgi:hypothetical protein
MKWMALVLLATPAMGQDRPIIDYEALFRDKAAEVVVSDEGGKTFQTLSLPNGIVVQRSDLGIEAIDRNEGQAVGCFFMLYVDLGSALQACPALGTPEERLRHVDYMSRINGFVAANAYPPMTLPEVEGLVQSLQARGDAPGCEQVDNADMAWLIENLLGAEFGAVLDRALAMPRLPVNDCL